MNHRMECIVESDLIRELYAVVDERRWDELDRVFDTAIVYERPGYAPFEGLARIRTFYERERVIADGRHHLSSALVMGDEGASCGVLIGVHRSGAPLEEQFADFFRFRDGKIVSRKTFFFRAAI